MRTCRIAAALLCALADTAAAGSISEAVRKLEDGKVRFAFAARPGVFGDGERLLITGRRTIVLDEDCVQGYDWATGYDSGPVRVTLTVRDARVVPRRRRGRECRAGSRSLLAGESARAPSSGWGRRTTLASSISSRKSCCTTEPGRRECPGERARVSKLYVVTSSGSVVLDAASIGDSFGGIQDLNGHEVSIRIVVENDAGLVFVALRNTCIVLEDHAERVGVGIVGHLHDLCIQYLSILLVL